jgi:hypothetical protein
MKITGGVMPDEPFSEEANKAYAEHLKRQKAEAKAEADAAAYAAELRKRCNEIDLFCGKNMRPQIEAQRVVLRQADKARFRDLLEFCRDNEWPTNLPIMAHAFYEYCVSESAKGYKHILSIVRSIGRIHEAAGEDMCCPTRDPLVRALLALCREEEEANQNSNQEGI